MMKDDCAYGKLYYDTGELMYEGYFTPADHDALHHEAKGRGVMYFKNGVVYREGQFQHGGLFEGKEYYPSGKLKFVERYNCRAVDGSYYGPTYPIKGKYYDENGALLYEGDFEVRRWSTVGYPTVVLPEGFGPLK